MRLGGLSELASGVDALYLTGRASLPEILESDLQAARDLARNARRGWPLDLGAETFLVASTGLLRWPYRLEHVNGVVGLSPSGSIPTVRVQLRAAFIHGVGPEAAMAWFVDLLEAALGAVEWKASRVDLFVDTQGWSLGSEDRGRFVCRAKKLVTHEDGESLTGFQFGSRKSGALTARIYDKTVEVADKGSDWWFAKWGDSFQPGERVLRVEFEVNRPALKEMKLDAPSAVLESAPAIWGYVTDDWLTYRTPAADGTRSRWPVAPEWRDIQRASLRGGALGLDRVQAGVAQGSLRNMLPALRGYLVSAGAHLGVSTLEETLHRVGRVLSLDEQRTGIPFSDRIAERRLGWVAS